MADESALSSGIGRRIKEFRERRGVTQTALAAHVGRGSSWLSQIEAGKREIDSYRILVDIANYLHVSLQDLTGHPLGLAPNGRREHDTVPRIREVLHQYPAWIPEPSAQPDLRALRHRVTDLWERWQASKRRYSEIGPQLPGALTEAQQAARYLSGDDRRRALGMLAELYQLARAFLKRVGELELALMVADRAVTIAYEADHLPLIAASAWNMGMVYSSQGKPDEARHLVREAIRALEPTLPDGSSDHLAMWGALHMLGGILAARTGDNGAAWDALREADRAASRTGERNTYWTVFGPTNVGIHTVGVALELGDSRTLQDQIRLVDGSLAASVERRFTHQIQVARAHSQRGEPDATLFALLAAEEESPEDTAFSIEAQQMTRVLLRHERRVTQRAKLRGLAQRIGVLN
ncbi:hypothetical protein C3Y87_02930 [Carbonactinospora thermoautotrophica]|uniref:helix-turn-helix domain-containing protein n=1 Tax=Carbonactinospora thermoautotrophica TaxID=1469144 RepID=UPI00226E35A4|nr:helix-turn-helix transcriptional regulator [Carbonactinospora thermoautotrophica]MCX9190386.1 hypothetical protein [Carbonactinospora thermoautotrophica]